MSFYVYTPQAVAPEQSPLLVWDEIEIGASIVVDAKSGLTHRGVVDAVTYDGRIIWLLPEWPASRRMIHIDDVVGIWKQSES